MIYSAFNHNTAKREKQNQQLIKWSKTARTNSVTFACATISINPALLLTCVLLKYMLSVHKYTEINSPQASSHGAVAVPHYTSGQFGFWSSIFQNLVRMWIVAPAEVECFSWLLFVLVSPGMCPRQEQQEGFPQQQPHCPCRFRWPFWGGSRETSHTAQLHLGLNTAQEHTASASAQKVSYCLEL